MKSSKKVKITDNNGEVNVPTEYGNEIIISHINYKTLNITLPQDKKQHIIYINRRNKIEIEEVVVKAKLDLNWIGKWHMKSAYLVKNHKNGKTSKVWLRQTTDNIKQYTADNLFLVSNGDEILTQGKFTTAYNQLIEEVIDSSFEENMGRTSIINYQLSENKKYIIVLYQLPSSENMKEEHWERIK